MRYAGIFFVVGMLVGAAGCEMLRPAHAQPAPIPPVYPQPAAPAPTLPAVAHSVPPDFNDGFCAGWNSAVQVEAQRHANWRALVMSTRTEDGAKTQVGQAADILVNSVPVYVLLQPATGSLTLSDGRVVNCAAPIAPGAAK